MTDVDRAAFSAAERDFIRREFCKHFGSFATLADGIFLRTWRSGLQADQPKIPKALGGLIERGVAGAKLRAGSDFLVPATRRVLIQPECGCPG